MALKHFYFAACLSVALALAGCGGMPRAPTPAVPVEERPGPPARDARQPELPELEDGIEAPGGPVLQRQAEPAVEAGPAALTLLAEAGSEARAGNEERAGALLERALRIEPKNPLLWHRLAALRLQQGEYDQAVAFASKSNTLAIGQDQLLAANWQLIAHAKTSLGDPEGARLAHRRAAQYTSGTK